MSASYKKCIAKQAGIFPGFTAHKWRQISKIRHMGFLQNGPIYLYPGRFPQKVMDSKRFLRSSEHDFCSCGRQRKGSFQKFANAKLNLDSISSKLCLFKQARIWLQSGGDQTTGLKNFFFIIRRADQELRWTEQESFVSCSEMWVTELGGSIVWGTRRQDYCLIYLWLETVSCLQLQYFKLVILNICL